MPFNTEQSRQLNVNKSGPEKAADSFNTYIQYTSYEYSPIIASLRPPRITS